MERLFGRVAIFCRGGLDELTRKMSEKIEENKAEGRTYDR
jgi:hypothetical protein